MGVLEQMTKNYIFQKSQILLYKIPKDGGAKAPFAPPVPPTLLVMLLVTAAFKSLLSIQTFIPYTFYLPKSVVSAEHYGGLFVSSVGVGLLA